MLAPLYRLACPTAAMIAFTVCLSDLRHNEGRARKGRALMSPRIGLMHGLNWISMDHGLRKRDSAMPMVSTATLNLKKTAQSARHSMTMAWKADWSCARPGMERGDRWPVLCARF